MDDKLRRRMGRLDPNDPHAFVAQPVDTDAFGGMAGASRACAICDRTFDDPLHGGTDKPIRERHGPFGQ